MTDTFLRFFHRRAADLDFVVDVDTGTLTCTRCGECLEGEETTVKAMVAHRAGGDTCASL